MSAHTTAPTAGASLASGSAAEARTPRRVLLSATVTAAVFALTPVNHRG